MDLELPTGFDAAQHAYQSVAHTILGQDVAGDGLFVELTGIEILHRASASLGCSQGSFLDPLGDLLLRIVVGLGTTCNDTPTGTARNASVSPHPRMVSRFKGLQRTGLCIGSS